MFYLYPIAEAEIDKIISNFKDSAEGWDELMLSIIKNLKNSIKMPSTYWQSLFWHWNIPYRTKSWQLVRILV